MDDKKEKARWVYIGRRLSGDHKELWACFLALDANDKPIGDVKAFSAKVVGRVIGGVYEVTRVLKEEGETLITGGEERPAFMGVGEFADKVSWETEDERAIVIHARARREKKAKAEPLELTKILEPIKRAMRKTDGTGRTLIKINVMKALDHYLLDE